MLAVCLFWCATLVLLSCALGFILPPIWLNTANIQLSGRLRLMYSGLLVLLIGLFSFYAYSRLGAAQHLASYYSADNSAQRQSYKLIRPLYSHIQRELIKDKLDLQIDLANIDIILNFSKVHSQAQQGLLQPEIQQLLKAVLKAVPQQVTAMNLLAIHAYKTKQFPEAISYWQGILQQFTPAMRNTELEQILQDKIDQTKLKLANEQKTLN